VKQLTVAYSQTTDPDTGDETTTFGVTLKLKFPQNWEVGATILIVDNKLSEISVSWAADSPQTRIPIGTTGLYLTEMDATVANIDNPTDLLVSGHMAAEFGNSANFFGTTATMLRAEGAFSVDKNHLDMSANIWLGAYASNGHTSGVLGSGNGHV